MSDEAGFVPANAFHLSGDGVAVTFDTTSIGGAPVGSATVDGVEATDVVVDSGPDGWTLRAFIGGIPDARTTTVTVLAPDTNVDDGEVEVQGVAIVVVSRTSIGGRKLVNGPIQSYDVRALAGAASVRQSIGGAG